MKFKVRLVVEVLRETDTPEKAADFSFAGTRCVPGRPIKTIGVVPAGQHWPGEEPEQAKPFTRPPRNTPPSGSPGTPILDKQPEPASAVAA